MLEGKGLKTVEDLLAYPPFRYEDRSNVKPIAQLAPGEMATVMVQVRTAHLAHGRGGPGTGPRGSRCPKKCQQVGVGLWVGEG
jgi:ATP-dependent DNA helicase RecG